MIENLKQLPTRTKILLGALVVVAVLFLASSIVNWYTPPAPQPQTFTEAPAIPQLAKVPKKTISVPNTVVLEKDVVVKKMGDKLPAVIKDNPDIEITASATTDPSNAGYDIVSTIDKKDGKAVIFYKEKERSLFEFESSGRIGVAYGISSDAGKQTAKVYGDYTFFRVGDVHVNLQAEIRATHQDKTEALGLVGVEYRFGKN